MKPKSFSKKINKIISFLVGKKKRCSPFTFEVHITDYCNLNCQGCFHFSPLAKKGSTYDLGEFERDFRRMHVLFENDVGWIHLMGGEPLLCNNVEDYLAVARHHFPFSKISLITNGILLPKSSDHFFKTCRDLDIEIAITRYPIAFDYDFLESFVRSKECRVRLFGNRGGESGMKKMNLQNGDLQNYKRNFLSCNLSNTCITLDRGKLFYCSVPAYINFFNDFFGQSFDNSSEYILLEKSTKKEIVEFLRCPHVFCKYCDVKNRERNRLPWEVSQKKIEEWCR